MKFHITKPIISNDMGGMQLDVGKQDILVLLLMGDSPADVNIISGHERNSTEFSI